MTPDEFHTWRRARKVTQKRLAEIFKVSLRTIINWESGATRFPKDIAERMEHAAANLIPRSVETPPEWISLEDHPQLFEAHRHHLHQIRYGEAHPYPLIHGGWLAWPGITEANISLRKAPWPEKWPASILETAEYKDALARFRAGLPGWPTSTQEDRARTQEQRRAWQEEQNAKIRNGS